ncbi:MAG: TetR/AcrR family transcriptional regulator, ethionamide resistance regulator [Thermoleophilaceae bacterium]|nr:TetR/AcrR family transcriptional regulator, ethionamide resistance regulator [Thermoleophilaceae bacterium]
MSEAPKTAAAGLGWPPMALLSRRDSQRADERRARRAAVQARVMTATEELLSEGSTYAELPIEAIAARAGISRTTFYDYFGDKRELLLGLGRSLTAGLAAETDEWRPGADGEATRDELRRIVRSMAHADKHPVSRAIVEATFYDLEVRAAWVSYQEGQIARAIRLLEAERAAGRFRAGGSTLEARARAIYWMIQQTILQEVALRRNLDETDVIEAIVDVALLGVRGIPR